MADSVFQSEFVEIAAREPGYLVDHSRWQPRSLGNQAQAAQVTLCGTVELQREAFYLKPKISYTNGGTGNLPVPPGYQPGGMA